MTNAFNQLEQATSIADLRALVDSLDATAPWLDNPLGLTVQLYGGITLDNKEMNKECCTKFSQGCEIAS